MNHIGQNIRRLRQEQGLSQEALAELLNITPAAVSKWENGITSPDLSQLVPLTTIFHVTADQLLGIGSQDENAAIEALLTSIYQMEVVYPPEEGIHIVNAYRDAVKKYPRNLSLLSEALSFSVGLLTLYGTVPEKDQKPLIDDCTLWANRILTYGTTVDQISHARKSLIDLYAWRKEWDRAIELAGELPGHLYDMRDITLADLDREAGRGAEERDLRARNVDGLLRMLGNQVTMLANRYRLDGNYTDALTCYEWLLTILDSLYGPEDYRPPFLHGGLHLYGFPAECALKLGDTEKALDFLEAYARRYLAERAAYNKQTTVDSPLLRGNHYAYGYDGAAAFTEYAQRDLQYPAFDPIREHPRFRAIVEKLKPE